MFEILVADLDGTLLGSGGTVSSRNRDALRAAMEAGMRVIVATGRTVGESVAALEAIAHQDLVIAAGGSIVFDVARGVTIDRRPIHADIVRETFEVLDRSGHATLVLKDRCRCGYDYLVLGSAALDPASEWWFSTLPVTVRYAADPGDDEDADHTVRIGAVAGAADLGPIARELGERLTGRADLQHWPAVTSSEAIGSTTHLLEIFGPDVNKWTALQSLCLRDGVCTIRVIAIGDGLNDVHLVRNAGLGIAMGNAIEQVRAAARRHTEHHDEDGFAGAVERVLAGEWD